MPSKGWILNTHVNSGVPGAAEVGDKTTGSNYVPPSLCEGRVKRSDGPNMARRDDSTSAIRISNLSDSTTQTDLEELVKPFGPIDKLYLAKHKKTGVCKGFAYIHFKIRSDAANAIARLNGFSYNNLILSVNWSGSKYVPPSLREGAVKRSDGPNVARRDDSAIRISNLSDFTTLTDLQELVRPFGPIRKLYLAKHKKTGVCKGFAYIHFKIRSDADNAIARLNGHCYDHLILSVNWSYPKPMTN